MTDAEAARKAREVASLKHILIAIEANERGSALRNFADNWFAYSRGGSFLSSGGNPHWFNNPDPHKHRDALLSMHFISRAASPIVRGETVGRLMVDHAIPLRILRRVLTEAEPTSPADVRDVLLQWYRIGVVTAHEDQRLNKLGLRSQMPPSWQGTDVFARYANAGIELCPIWAATRSGAGE